jgi:hypothetical protein
VAKRTQNLLPIPAEKNLWCLNKRCRLDQKLINGIFQKKFDRYEWGEPFNRLHIASVAQWKKHLWLLSKKDIAMTSC